TRPAPVARTTQPAPVSVAQAPVAPAPAPQAASTDGQFVYGRVAQIDARTRSVMLSFTAGNEPAVGTVISAHHGYLLGMAEVGTLEVIESRPGMIVAQPSGSLSLGKISKDDEVVYRRAAR